MSLAKVVKLLDWYSENEILNPSGYGAKVYAELVRKKIAGTLKIEKKIDANVGVLVNDPVSDKTQTPIAIVCEFQSEIDIETLNLTHKLSWNFCRSPLLIVIEPHRVRALSCYIEPEKSESETTIKRQLSFEQLSRQETTHKAEIFQFPIDKTHAAHQAAESLRWIELYSGQFFREQEKRGYFPTKQRVDYMLLENLKFIRKELIALKLDEDIVHDLLARIIFIQFLFQRKDSKGKPAIDDKFLEARYKDGTLSKEYKKLEEILESKTDTYNFFKWLNKKFNGDLFPGRSKTDEESEAEWKQEMEKVWKQEMKKVKPTHLKKLARFIGGKEKMKDGQLCLWQRYSFDVIPLEFISSIYEEFVTNDGRDEEINDEKDEKKSQDNSVHYTPSHLVDFILDSVLPWKSNDWNLKILDPACGSGIFLVKAFQRLIQRWKNANPDKPLDKDFRKVLTKLLEDNLFGVDINEHAVRVASFSLYLAMCDEIDPRHYWEKWEFPPMRGRQIVEKDFFEEHSLFPHRTEQIKYDLIIGNAPWSRSGSKKAEHIKKWAKLNDWTIPDKDGGLLFLPRAIDFLKPDGVISMLQSAKALLFNDSDNYIKFRKKLFDKYKITDIKNLSALRFGLFSRSISPTCIITMLFSPPDERPLAYICPKQKLIKKNEDSITVEPQDVHLIHPKEAEKFPMIWATLMWGGMRDLALLKKLVSGITLDEFISSLKDYKKGKIKNGIARYGFIRGKKAVREQPEMDNKLVLEDNEFPKTSFLVLDADKNLDRNHNLQISKKDYRKKDFLKGYEYPQLVLKHIWKNGETAEGRRFRAVLIKSKNKEGIICKDGYISFHVPDFSNYSILESTCLTFNSKFAVYFFFLTSGQFAMYRPKLEETDVLMLPIPEPRQNLLEGITPFDFEEIDRRIYNLFNLKDSEKILIEDLFDYTLRDFKDGATSLGRQRTERGTEKDLKAYCEVFRRVIKAGFGKDTSVYAKIFQEDKNTSSSPVRMIRLDFDVVLGDETDIELTSYKPLWERLESLEKNFSNKAYRYYEPKQEGVGITLYLVKPDQKRYWLRSQAYRDADEVYAEISQSLYKAYLGSLSKLDKEKKVA